MKIMDNGGRGGVRHASLEFEGIDGVKHTLDTLPVGVVHYLKFTDGSLASIRLTESGRLMVS